MRFRFGALLCLSGMVACSHQSTDVAKDPSYEHEPPVAASEPAMVPASLEDRQATPSQNHGDVDTRAPAANGSTSDAVRLDPPAGAPSTPSSSAAAPPTAAADNTQVNKRDANGAALTPMDQNNNSTDLQITQKIRQSVMADGSLSFTAKNVKIITQNGKVTLRGPVNSPEERNAIDAAARKVAGSAQVDNQLEVKK